MDYDKTDMPAVYDLGRNPPDGVLDMWLGRIATAAQGLEISTIVDLGCGTGRFSEPLAARFGANVIGVDPSAKMLSVAKSKSVSARVTFVEGSGENIPCPDASADLIFISMAFHHFRSRMSVANECHRVLRAGGLLCLRNGTRDGTSPYERYFPNYRRTLDALPSAEEITETFAPSGFQQLQHQLVAHMMARNLDDLAEKAAFRADSTLVRLTQEDFDSGLATLRTTPDARNEPAMIDIDFFVFAKRRPHALDA
ncbi:MAG: class I SAM-dependent methyltransferase [Alphaproteobacteria bacterium]|nr:class I SAM-dependent methyltransferase [Alphaproteobacteria bacterium]